MNSADSTIQPFSDSTYVGLPWKDNGRDRAGLDCVGLAALWLKEQMGLEALPPRSDPSLITDHQLLITSSAATGNERGDILFFAAKDRKTGEWHPRHLAICLGHNRYLHAFKGAHGSVIVNGRTLIERLGFRFLGALSPKQSEALALALSDARLGEPTSILLFFVAIALSAASSFLMGKPNLGKLRNQAGAYSFDGLLTQTNTQLPLPDILGGFTVAGNSPYQSLVDKSQTVSDATQQKANKVIVLCAGPINDWGFDSQLISLNGLPYNSPQFFKDNSNTSASANGLKLDPAQTQAEAVTGTISSKSNRPSVSTYKGTYGITVPVDVRANYDRNFPVYGFNGSAYVVFRIIDSSKFSSFNCTVPVKGRHCRTFNSDGFIQTTATSESLAGASGGKVRFKLAHEDIVSVTSLTVNGTSYSPISAAAQTGNVYQLNATKGFVEFITAPANGATISITYIY